MLLYVSCLLFFLFMIQPETVFLSASEGLLLWFHTVLPTLFPFFVVTSLFISSNTLSFIKKYSIAAIVGGFSCGYPMGAKIISDLWHKNLITNDEAGYLLSFCNNASPMFISSYFVLSCLKIPRLLLPSILILFSSSIICSFLFRAYHYRCTEKHTPDLPDTSFLNSKSRSAIEVFDYAISNSMENIIKIGGYIIFFSILFKFTMKYFGFLKLFKYLIIPSLEITNGLKLLSEYNLFFWQKYIIMMGHLSFGGICAIFQTKCVLRDTPVSLGIYTLEKLITALVTSLLSYLYIRTVY